MGRVLGIYGVPSRLPNSPSNQTLAVFPTSGSGWGPPDLRTPFRPFPVYRLLQVHRVGFPATPGPPSNRRRNLPPPPGHPPAITGGSSGGPLRRHRSGLSGIHSVRPRSSTASTVHSAHPPVSIHGHPPLLPPDRQFRVHSLGAPSLLGWPVQGAYGPQSHTIGLRPHPTPGRSASPSPSSGRVTFPPWARPASHVAHALALTVLRKQYSQGTRPCPKRGTNQHPSWTGGGCVR